MNIVLEGTGCISTAVLHYQRPPDQITPVTGKSNSILKLVGFHVPTLPLGKLSKNLTLTRVKKKAF